MGRDGSKTEFVPPRQLKNRTVCLLSREEMDGRHRSLTVHACVGADTLSLPFAQKMGSFARHCQSRCRRYKIKSPCKSRLRSTEPNHGN
jgi:hypothetical protein